MWPNLTDEVRQGLLNAGSPPADFGSVAQDPTWLWFLAAYIAANEGQSQAALLAEYLLSCAQGAEMVDLMKNYGFEGATPITWPENLRSTMTVAMAGSGYLEDSARTDSVTFAVESLASWWAAFVDEIARIQNWAGREAGLAEWSNTGNLGRDLTEEDEARLSSRAVQTTMTIDQLDDGYIDGVNKYNLDELKPGELLEWRFLRGKLLLGVNKGTFAPAYLQVFDQNVETESNWLRLDARGTTFSTGKCTVIGFQGDQSAFKAAFRRFSKKNLAFS